MMILVGFGPIGHFSTHFVVWVHTTVEQKLNPKYDRPVALPPEACAIYTAYDMVLPILDCEDCGWRSPTGYGERQDPKVFGAWVPVPLASLSTCPLCGGRIGYCAYYYAHQKSA